MLDIETDIEQKDPCIFKDLTNHSIHAQKECFGMW